MNKREQWERYTRYLCSAPDIGLRLDISRMSFEDEFLDSMADPTAGALDAMARLERGDRVNVDEDRMVGHYWLREPALAPDAAIAAQIEDTVKAIKQFADDVHTATIRPQNGDGFYVVLVIGIGGSALGPQLLGDALGMEDDPMILRFLDNTDPDGIDRILAELDESLAQTLTIVISKSGGTKETRNGMLEVAEAYRRAGLEFSRHAVAITCDDSELHKQAMAQRWLKTFPIWDFVGGRTSVTSAVGLLPAALQGIDIDAFLAGARDCDVITRERAVKKNPAALLAMMWHCAGDGRGSRNMVLLPYRDRLALLGRYLQQLVMESIGKSHDRAAAVVHQGLTVLGNKGSTDQHALVQQLRDGSDDFFATFVTVGCDRAGESLAVEQDVTAGDYLNAFWQGTRLALSDSGRQSITIALDRLDPHRLGVLVALFERAVGLYAELINVNAYDQPGVEAGKQAAGVVLEIQRKVLGHLRGDPSKAQTAGEIAEAIGHADAVETVHHILQHISANRDHGVELASGTTPLKARFRARSS